MAKQVVLAFSGGLDTSYCVLYLREQGWSVITATINTGGFSDAELSDIEAMARRLGVEAHHAIDAREELFDNYLRYLVYGNVLRGNSYPLSVAAERVCQAVKVVEVAQHVGAQAVAHGSTGAGNDQVRFDIAFRVLAPELTIITPIRDNAFSRAEETSRLRAQGIEMPEHTATYSLNQGMWGASVGGQETLNSWDKLPESAYPGGEIGNPSPRSLSISFEQGVAVHVDGEAMAPLALIEKLKRLASPFGIGRGVHLGDTILGIKGRVGFEAAAAHLLIHTHRELEKLVLSGAQQQWKDTLGNLYGSLLHEARFFDPLARDLEAFLVSTQRRVTGEVRVTLYPRTFAIDGVRSPYSRMDTNIADYGETNTFWDGAEARAFTKLYGVSQLLAMNAEREGGKEY